jgi:DNA polymerase III subunit alpha
MPADFVHLHLHTHYSLLDGACTVKGLIEMAKLYDMPAVAMTDHGFMGGTIDMYQGFKKAKLNPIIGCEMYVSPTNRFDRNKDTPRIRGYHLVLLAKDITGYHSLCKLMSEAHINGMYYKPRIDKELLAEYSAGLIGLTACIGGEVPVAIIDNDMNEAKRRIGSYQEILGKDNFYLEIMDHGIPKELIVNRGMIQLSKELDIPLVATNDVHYLKKEHADAHDIMLCTQTQSKVDDPKRFKFNAPEYYFKSPEEMKELFKEVPQAVTNTVGVAERCNIEFKFAPEVNHYPVYDISSSGVGEKEYLRNMCLDAIPERYNFDPRAAELTEEQQKIIERLDYELGVIDGSHYCSYFLVVSDFIDYARKQKIPVGPGRGSGAGSLTAYLTHITDVDPLRYNLLFERFLNPERVSPPDFDIDFCEARRYEVIEYVRNKYGSESVAQIGTYGTLKAKAVIKDVARVLGHTFAEGDMITKLIPNDPKMTLQKAQKESAELRKLISDNEWVQKIFSYAEILEGNNRQMGIHAAGVIIGDQRLDNLVPLALGAHKEIITEFPAVPCEELGLLKMDFLGLKTLTVIQNAIDNIKKHRNIDLDITKIPLDDKPSFDLLNRGDTVAVFQLESSGMQNLCRQFGVETIEHIIALIAIYRPGPMQFIPEFVGRKKGTMKLEYDHPKMEHILKETYGIMLYQEQIMQVVQELAGFTLGGADILRRAIGKKKVEVLETQKVKFVDGCLKYNNINKPLAENIWEKIGMFAGYGFNKSHSAAYAFIAYHTAYLKANYPVEFMAGVLACEIDNAEKIAFIINECREMGIKVLPPDINGSGINFSVDGDAIRFGLGGIKGVGEAAAAKIMESREQDGKYSSLLDFCERVGRAVNSRMNNHLNKSGAFDSLGLKRSQVEAVIDDTMSYAQSRIKDKEAGQGSLFDMLDESEQEEIFNVPVPDIPEFDENEILKTEKELLGFYITGHPLAKFSDIINTYSSDNLRNIAEYKDNLGVRIGGIVKTVQTKISKKGSQYQILAFEDLNGVMECMVYEKCLEKMQQNGVELVEDMPIFIEALTSKREETERLKLVAENITPLQAVIEHHTEEIHLHVYEGSTSHETVNELLQLCQNNPGEAKVIICISTVSGEIVFIESSHKYRVNVNEQLLESIKGILGERRFKLKPDEELPVPRRRYVPKPKAE